MGIDGFAIGELSRRTGCKIETVRYYERVGLLPTPARRDATASTRRET
jgi:MerR family transcriptional regulator, mercuric resistance operon regulatory protein